MKNSFVILVGVLLTAVLLTNMFCYQVRYDQVAVQTWRDGQIVHDFAREVFGLESLEPVATTSDDSEGSATT